jgi:DNA modification methylase
VLEDSEIDVIAAFESGVDDMAKRLSANHLRGRCEVFGGDARALTFLADGSIDAIITSPPYLNAIDYMRGHRLALVWLGQHLSRLRTIRGDSVGAERGMEEARTSPQMASFLAEVGWYAALSPRMKGVVRRYAHDVLLIAKEAARVLKTSGTATVVVGNSSVEGIFIPNSEIVSFAFRQYRLEATDVAIRHIPESKRYLPLANAKSTNSLSKRIRTESVTRFRRQ